MKTVIDVSEYNGRIDWPKVKVDGAILRVGYRGYGSSGTLVTDKRLMENMQGALASGLPIGAYFCSTAISDNEAKQEAAYVASLLKGYEIKLPVYLDSEDMSPGKTDTRLDKLSKTRLTQYGLTFCKAIKEAGYIPGLYCSESWYTARLDGPAFDKLGCSIWIAKYSSVKPKYRHDAWQYTSSGTTAGVSGRVDMNYFYTEYVTKEPDGVTSVTKALIDGKLTELTRILHKDENYIRLRDLSMVLDIDYDPVKKLPIINSK